VAGAAAAEAGAGTAAEGRSVAPALVEARAQTLLIGILRLALSAAGLAAAIAAGARSAGIGGAALGFGVQLAAWERQRGARVFSEPGRGGRVFEVRR
jgi:hypothetical protein